MPDARELPGLRRPVVEEVRAGVAFVDELVALSRRHAAGSGRDASSGRLPGLAAVARALDHLAEPPARLRCVDPVRVRGGTLDVVDLPAPEVRPAHVPLTALAIRS